MKQFTLLLLLLTFGCTQQEIFVEEDSVFVEEERVIEEEDPDTNEIQETILDSNVDVENILAKGVFEFSEETYDFGEIEEGPKYAHIFSFVNTGKAAITITRVRASCGCTTPSHSRDYIEPGETGFVKVLFNSFYRPGNFNKAITIESDAATPIKRLFIKGKVIDKQP